MRIHVCVKEIQNPEIASSVFRVDETAKAVIPVPGLPLVTSPFDEQAIEAALRIRDKAPDTKITIVTFGPKGAQAALKRGLAMGADDGVWISNEGLEDADGYATACVLADAIARSGEVGLVLTGRQAADWDAGIVGCGIAERLSVPVVSFAKDVRVEDGRVIVERVLEAGFETVETSAPCVVTVSNELGEPRKASLRETMRAAKKPVVSLTVESLGENGRHPGAGRDPGSSIRQVREVRERLFIPSRDIECELFEGSSQEIAARLAGRLFEAKVIA